MALLRGKPSVRGIRLPAEGAGFCMYPHRVCMQTRVDASEYCVKHVLLDEKGTAAYKQCNYISNRNSKRCPNAAPKSEKKDGYCHEHTRKAIAARQKAGRKRRPHETPETLLESLDNYVQRPEENAVRETRRSSRISDNQTARILEYASSSDSESEQALVGQAWREDADSDAESIDSEHEDPLKHAGVYTAEEVAQITRDKLIRLQSLYIEQFKRLQHVLKEKRRRYLHTARRERDTLGSIHSAKEDPEQREKYEELGALKRYHNRFGKEALLHRQSKERRIAVTEGPNYKPPSYPKCIFMCKGLRCAARTVPLSKFCRAHIMQDPHQVLYQACQYGDRTVCQRPVAMATLTGGISTCLYHSTLQDPRKHYPPQPAVVAAPDLPEPTDEVKDSDIFGEDVMQLEEHYLGQLADTSGMVTPQANGQLILPDQDIEQILQETQPMANSTILENPEDWTGQHRTLTS